MSDEKKPESKWEEAERLGPYQLHEQVVGSAHHSGELFRATHETSGVTALVFKPAQADTAPLPDWRVRCVSSGAPGYISMEVESSPWSFGSDSHSVEELLFMAEGLREGVQRLTRLLVPSDEARPRRRLGLAVAGAVAVCALSFLLVYLTRMSSSPVASERMVAATAEPTYDMVPTDLADSRMGHFLLRADSQGRPAGIALPFPRKPYKGQSRPPCTPRIEEEIMGACWVPHELKAPCPDPLYEYKGKCYSASMLPPKVPQSVEP